MIELFSLGEIYVSDWLKNNEEPRHGKHELKLVMEPDTRAVRLEKTVPPEKMFGKYFYRSGLNNSMRTALKDVVDSILPLKKWKENDVWLDLASNDGSLLSFVPSNFIRIGIDPADDTYKVEAEKHADVIVQDFFSKQAYFGQKFGSQKVKVCTCIAMLYDLENPDGFFQDVYEILDDDGIFVAQLSYSGLMIDQIAFDNILHEHVYYYCLKSLQRIFQRNGFKLMDVQLNDVNGGSFRIFLMKDKGNEKTYSTQPHRDVCATRVASLLAYEEKMCFDEPEPWIVFYDSILALKAQLVDFMAKEKEKGKTFYGYASSTKSNTLLPFFGLDSTLITAIAEKSPTKWGLRTVGTNIPIVSEEEMRKAQPDYLLVLAWHFISEFQEREIEYLKKGGKLIVPCPRFEIISL